jgi:uncharacterized iron-regulated protein
MLRIILFTTITLLLLIIPAFAGESGLGSPVLPHRIYDMRTQSLTDLEGLVNRCIGADVVTLGENHGDPATARIELALLMGLARLGKGKVVLSMEMFERDIQDVVDEYLGGGIDEEEFMASANPPLTYKTDCRPLIEYCKEHGIHVVASNFPNRLTLKVGDEGYDAAVAGFTEEERRLLPEIYNAPDDAYRKKIVKTMLSMAAYGGMRGMTEELTETYYQAQVLMDETMAESVYKASIANPGYTVYHIVGSFHVEDYLGTYSRIKQRMPTGDLLSILVYPVDDLLTPRINEIPGCDFLILVLRDPEEKKESQ